MKNVLCTFFILLSFFMFCSIANARTLNVLIYADFREPSGGEIKEHWKPEIPDVGVDEVVRNFRVIARQGTKRFFHCLIETDEVTPKQMERIKSYIDTFNEGKAINEQILFWHGATALDAYRALWQDRTTDPFIEAIAKNILQYPIRHFTEDEDDPIKASSKEAEDKYGLTIQNSVLTACGERCIPHKFFGK